MVTDWCHNCVIFSAKPSLINGNWEKQQLLTKVFVASPYPSIQSKPALIMAHGLGLFCFNLKYIVSFSVNKHHNNGVTSTTNTMMVPLCQCLSMEILSF